MMKDWSRLTKNFNWSEFFDIVKSGSVTRMDSVKAFYMATILLQPVRDEFDNPIIVTSGKRSLKHNKKIGGAVRSDHLFRDECAACDFTFQDKRINRKALYWIGRNRLGAYGQLIAYDDGEIVRWIHISMPSRKHLDESFTNRISKEGRVL